MSYLKDIHVDQNDLEQEWGKNTRLAVKWAKRLARAEYQTQMAETNYKIMKATIESEVRQDPIEFGLKKETDASVLMCVRQDPRYAKAAKRLAIAKKNEGIIRGIKETIQFQRPKTCEGLTQLWIFLYNQEKRIPKTVREAMDAGEVGLDSVMKEFNPVSIALNERIA